MLPFFTPDLNNSAFQQSLQACTDELQVPKRGASTLFRTCYVNQLELSSIADRKAHFMIALNVFLISLVVLNKSVGLMSPAEYLLWPNLVLVASSMVAIVLAIIATRPALPRRPVPGDNRPVNWFFFGSFCHRPLEEYHQNIRQLMLDEKSLYNAMSRDLHLMGKSLAKKYRLLTRCYQFFYYGLLLTVAGYSAAFAWHFWQ